MDSIRWECSKRRHMGCPFQIFTSLPENGAPIKALSMKKPQVHTCSAEKLTPLMHKFRLKLASRMQDDLVMDNNMERREATSSRRSKRSAWASSTGDLRDGRCRALPPNREIFVQVQTFWRVPPVLPCNFCHPGDCPQ